MVRISNKGLIKLRAEKKKIEDEDNQNQNMALHYKMKVITYGQKK